MSEKEIKIFAEYLEILVKTATEVCGLNYRKDTNFSFFIAEKYLLERRFDRGKRSSYGEYFDQLPDIIPEEWCSYYIFEEGSTVSRMFGYEGKRFDGPAEAINYIANQESDKIAKERKRQLIKSAFLGMNY